MANVRQWLQDPKGAGTSAAREAATLTDQALHSMVVDMSGLPLACIRRMYVLKACGKPEQVRSCDEVQPWAAYAG